MKTILFPLSLLAFFVAVHGALHVENRLQALGLAFMAGFVAKSLPSRFVWSFTN